MSKVNENGVSRAVIHTLLGRPGDSVRSEREQAFLRLGILAATFCYLLLLTLENGLTEQLRDGFVFISSVSAVALGILASTYLRPVESGARKVFGAAMDLFGFSIALILTEEAGAPWFGIYLWVIFGNTLRYGMRHLYISTSFAVAGFSCVLLVSDYWQSHTSLGVGLLVSLVVLPGYAAALAQRLRNAQLAAESANRAKSQFLANMSHEIRTPLNGILGAAELLRERELPDKERHFVDVIGNSGAVLLQLINNILDLSKIEANKLVTETRPFDLHAFLGALTEMMEIHAHKRGIRLLCCVDPRVPYKLKGDEQYLKQTLINLMSNGIKFTEKGEVELRCELVGAVSGSSVELQFSVRDTGIGIPVEQQEKILEPFTQAEGSAARLFGGTGLGTTIARDLVRLMGGELSLDSVPGEGTTFRFTLPLELDDAVSPASDTLPMVGRSVLVLSANEAAEETLSSRLHAWSIDVLAARDASEAEQLLREMSRGYVPVAAVVVDAVFAETLPERWRGEGLLADDVKVIVSAMKESADAFPEEKRLSPYRVWVANEEELFNALHSIHFPCELEDFGSVNVVEKVRPLNILITDDNSANRLILASMLRNEGHRVIETDSGQAFLDAVEEEEFDLALVDMHMPDMSGIDTFQLYRFAHASDEMIPFVVITADVTEATRTACRDAGIEHMVSKPIDRKQLLDTIEKLTGGEDTVSVAEEVDPQPDSLEEVPMVDADKVEELMVLDTGTTLVVRILDYFMQDAGDTIAQMRKALEERDYYGMKDLAHALRGSAANVGLPQVQLASEQLELQPETRFMGMHPGQIDELEELVHESVHQLAIQFGLEKPRPNLRVVS